MIINIEIDRHCIDKYLYLRMPFKDNFIRIRNKWAKFLLETALKFFRLFNCDYFYYLSISLKYE